VSTRKRLRDNDLRFIEFARGLAQKDWEQPSLCSGWSNHEVLAHLVVGYMATPVALGAAMMTQRGSFDRANEELARDAARRRNPSELLDDFGELMRRPRGIGLVFPRRLLLGDHVIHELDIALALDTTPTIEAASLTAVLDTQVRVPNPFVPAAARARGLTLQATDVDWSHRGGAQTVRGTAAHLASVLAGRPHALDHLTGIGVDTLKTRI
jgi:uncharacterized protein (TIGR03083 family)